MSSGKSVVDESSIDGNISQVCDVNEWQAMDSNECMQVFDSEDDAYWHGVNRSRCGECHLNNMVTLPESELIDNDMSTLCCLEDDISMFYLSRDHASGTSYLPCFQNTTCHNPGNLMDEACGLHTGDIINCSIAGSLFEAQGQQNATYLLPWQVTAHSDDSAKHKFGLISGGCDTGMGIPGVPYFSFECFNGETRQFSCTKTCNKTPVVFSADSEVAWEAKNYDSMLESVFSEPSTSDVSMAGCSLEELFKPNEGLGNSSDGNGSSHKSRHEFCHVDNAGVGHVSNDSETPDFASTVSTAMDEELVMREPKKSYNVVRNKAASGGNFVKRPRDRQMIQDHLKVLRDIVPAGSKCSIDNLLHRSIRHMLFLRMATERDKKFMNCLDYEVMMKTESRGFHDYREIKHFPVVLEDLQCPGHLLIEIFCEEHGLFLEITQVILSLGLTILKGWMGKRRSRSCATFVVETGDKVFSRMEIFGRLLHLLQLARVPTATNRNG